ncbi:MAG: DUF1844 domain-containing protein, partial [Deltaproteobacteria bacterium]|nr:DUF1844 domain-containing protein [Deltaproteobacteria bacterium]
MDSEEEKEQTKGFKVEDRRRFSSEGELKPEHKGAEQPQAQTSTPSADETARAALTGGTSSRTQEAQASRPLETAPEITFGTFVVGLSTQTLVHLGELPDPNTNQPATDLAAAQQLIDIIAMLETKTRGNLDSDEQAMLEA